MDQKYPWNVDIEIGPNDHVQCIQILRIDSRVRAFGVKINNGGFRWAGNDQPLTSNEILRSERKNFCFGQKGIVTGFKAVVR